MHHLANFYKHKAEQLQEKYNKLCVLLEQSAGIDPARMYETFSYMNDKDFNEYVKKTGVDPDTEKKWRDERTTRRRARGIEPSEVSKMKDFYTKHKGPIKEIGAGMGTVALGLPLGYAASYAFEDTPDYVASPITGAATLGSGQAAVEVGRSALQKARGVRTPPVDPRAKVSPWSGTKLGRVGQMTAAGALGGLVSVPFERAATAIGFDEPSMVKDVLVSVPTAAGTEGLISGGLAATGKIGAKEILPRVLGTTMKWGVAAPIAMSLMMDKVAGAQPYPLEEPTEEQIKAAEEYEEERKRKWEEEHGPSKPLDLSPMLGSEVSAAAQRISSKAKQRAEDVYGRQNY